MGITSFSVQLIEKHKADAKSVIELGAQNMYNQPKLPAPYASEYYETLGIDYACIDLNGENGALKIDLSKPLKKKIKPVDLLTDFGTSKHVSNNGSHGIEAFYNCWHAKHSILKEGGTMINENPKTGNWPGHGCNYYTEAFYRKLAELCGYEILELGEHPAMGNVTDGWNVYCVFKKINDNPFISLDEFKTLEIHTS